jgi:hypothetical protein
MPLVALPEFGGSHLRGMLTPNDEAAQAENGCSQNLKSSGQRFRVMPVGHSMSDTLHTSWLAGSGDLVELVGLRGN